MSQHRAINIGFLGFGTVGSGAATILQQHQSEISARVGVPLQIKAICSPNIKQRDTSFLPATVARETDPLKLIEDPDIDILVEAIGGLEPAQRYLKQALQQGKSIITANKLLLAQVGPRLAENARSANRSMGIEAAVAGGIPVLNAIREGLAGEKINSLYGILNGTTNYILTEMEQSGQQFDAILATAQQLGYAEADPSLDVEGWDARDKLAILAMMAFGQTIKPADISTIGITRLMPIDFTYAAQLDCTIRLLCSAELAEQQQLAVSVRPTLVPRNSMLAKVTGSFNAVLINGVAGGRTMYYGRGAGSGPTGIAIVSDIVRIARELAAGVHNLSNPFGYQNLTEAKVATATTTPRVYALRFLVEDRSGIIAQLASVLAKYQINIDAVLQEKQYQGKDPLPFVITLAPAPEQAVRKALTEINQFDFLISPPLAMPIAEIG